MASFRTAAFFPALYVFAVVVVLILDFPSGDSGGHASCVVTLPWSLWFAERGWPGHPAVLVVLGALPNVALTFLFGLLLTHLARREFGRLRQEPIPPARTLPEGRDARKAGIARSQSDSIQTSQDEFSV